MIGFHLKPQKELRGPRVLSSLYPFIQTTSEHGPSDGNAAKTIVPWALDASVLLLGVFQEEVHVLCQRPCNIHGMECMSDA
jgi:hypothetical protein